MNDALKLDYLNGLLPEKERILFEEHLADCPACRQEIAALRETAAAVAGLTLPAVPADWTAAAKGLLRAKRPSPVAAVPLGPARALRRRNLLQYAAIAAGVTAGLVLLLLLVMGGAVQHWLPGLSTAALGISAPRTARTVNIVTWILSLHALMLIPLIIDNIYRLVRRGGKGSHSGSFAGFSAC